VQEQDGEGKLSVVETLHVPTMMAAPLACHLFPVAPGYAAGTGVFRALP
jgi:hypothetical protein